jgi:NADH:ubiquinone reductase (non-electrogenic)
MTFYKAKVEDVDFDNKTCSCRSECEVQDGEDQYFDVPYDRLILAPGYFCRSCMSKTTD